MTMDRVCCTEKEYKIYSEHCMTILNGAMSGIITSHGYEVRGIGSMLRKIRADGLEK